MTIEAVKDAFCERECNHFGVSPFEILDAIGAKIVEEYAKMVEELQRDPRIDLAKPQLDSVLINTLSASAWFSNTNHIQYTAAQSVDHAGGGLLGQEL